MTRILSAKIFAVSVLVAILFCPEFSVGQKAKAGHVLTTDEAKIVKKDAATLFISTDYKGALAGYKDLVKADPSNVDYNYRLGVCYLMTNVDKTAALDYLDKGKTSKDAKKDLSFYMGLANMYKMNWDAAIEGFQSFKQANAGKPMKDFLPTDRMIEMCKNGKELSATKVNVTFTNMGKGINTPFEEYNPFVSADNKELVFTSRRKGNIGGFIEDLGIYTSDLYWCVWKDTIWSKPKGLGGIVNSEWDEESVGLSALGDQLFIYFDNVEAFADLGIASIKGKTWQKPVMMPELFNSKQYEGGACTSLDGSVIIFSSNRKDALGGNDLWIVEKEKSGEWGAVTNLGSVINTKYDEESPFLTMDGKTLYFSSKGHNSMGGYDLFKSLKDPATGKWGAPVNLGMPINDADDNSFFSLTGDGRFAYFSALMKGGFGDRDIWKIEYNDTTDHPFQTLITGNVSSTTGTRIELTKVTLTNKADQSVLVYKPNTTTNAFILSAAPGEYSLSVEGYNFAPYTEDISVRNEFPPKEMNKQIAVTSTK
ncbi:MAG: PD40 domain-containing protein [Bacteroidetes bacterium]|nr:PD40 domain-containing protein [Bacteroidota bacterium]